MKRSTTLATLIALAASGIASCSSGAGGTKVIVVSGWDPDAAPGTTTPATPGAPGSGGAGGAGGGGSTGDAASPSMGGGGASATGVPCNVATMLGSMCTSCHSDPPVGGSLAGLVTYADLMAPAHENPTMNEAQLS